MSSTSDIYRALRRGWIDNLTGEPTTAAFLKRDPKDNGASPDADGLSVSTDSVEHCRTTLTNPYGVATLSVRCVQSTGLDVIPDVPKHANINTDLPLQVDDLGRAEYLAGKLLECADVVWRKYPVP